WGHFWDFRIGDPTSESCASCHVMEPYFNSQHDPVMLNSVHASHDVGCVDCHDYGLEHQINDTLAYLRNEYQEPLQRVEYGMDMCFECHVSYEQLARRTTDLGVTDAQAKGHDANPHQPPHYSNLECSTCHRIHRPSTLLCSECHSYQYRYPVVIEATEVSE